MCIALCFGCKSEDSQTIKDTTMDTNDTSKVIIEPTVSKTYVEVWLLMKKSLMTSLRNSKMISLSEKVG